MLKRALGRIAILLLAGGAASAVADVLFAGPGMEPRFCPVSESALRDLAIARAMLCFGVLLIAAVSIFKIVRDWAGLRRARR
ncbi:MAG: hypothetical protein JNM60_11300 [Candidatus Competibacteraceae bacterium]|nr:hypothetical protein [Candidatus Competibacteraceae bacterium]